MPTGGPAPPDGVDILYIHQLFATRESTHPTRSYEFARRMVEDGHRVTMLTGASRLGEPWESQRRSSFEVDGIAVEAISNAYSNYMSYGRRMLSFGAFAVRASLVAVRLPKPDVVFATSTPLTVGIPGYVAARLRRVPFVFEVRDVWPEAAIQMGALPRRGVFARTAFALERFLYRKADAIVALSPGMSALVLGQDVDPDRVHTVPNCSDLDLFHPGDKDTATLERHGVSDRFVVGYAGAIGPSNAVEVAVEGARLLAERGRDDIAFLIAGDGKSLPGIRAYVEEHGLDNVRLVDSIPKAEIPAFLRSADVLMTLFDDVPILATNSPNKFFDGLASGRAMLVNSPGWTRDIVESEECGVYVPPADPAALADAIERMADDPEGTARMGVEARRVAEERFDRDRLARELTGILADAVRSRQDRPVG